MKKIFSFILMLGLAFTLTACNNDAKYEKSITVAMALNESEWEIMYDVLDLFEEQTGIHVTGIHVEHGDMESKVEALHKAGRSEIDIIAPDNMRLSGLVTKGLILDLSDYESNIPTEVNKNLYEDFKFDGKLFYTPFRPNVLINFYNENKFNDLGLSLPTDWDSLLNMAKTMEEKEGVERYLFQAGSNSSLTVTLFEFIRSAGGDPLVLNDKGSVEAYTFLQELWQYTSAESLTSRSGGTNNNLATDTVYYAANWPFAANILVKDYGKTEMKAYEGFSGPEGINKVLGGNVMAITSISENVEESKLFLDFIMSKETQEIFCSKLGWPPVREDAISTIEEWQTPYFEAINDALKHATPRPIVPYWSEVDKAVNDAFTDIVVNGATDIQGTLDHYHSLIETAKTNSEE